MIFDIATIACILAVAIVALRGGVLAAVAMLALLSAALAGGAELFGDGAQAVLLALGLWAVLSAGLVWTAPRFGLAARGRIAAGLLGAAQGAVAVVALYGALLGGPYRDVPDAAEALRGAALYPVVARAGGALEARLAALDYPAPVDPAARNDGASPPRPIDWAEARVFDGAAIRALPGELRAAERAPLAFEVEGRVADVQAQIGDHFEAGEVLATLDTHLLELALQEREAALIEAEARLDEARHALERQEALYRRGVVAEAVYESAVAALNSALSRQRVAQAGIEQAEDRLEDATLRAPYAGSVAARLAEPAQTVRAGEPVLEIQSNGGGFEVRATVPDTLVSGLSVGSDHRIRLLDGSGATFGGTLRDIGARSTGSAGFPITLAVEGAATALRAGMSVEVALAVGAPGRPDDLIAIPIPAFVPGEGQSAHVFVHDPATGTLSRRAVTLAGTEGNMALISAGLTEGEAVATRGVPFLEDGMPVILRGTGIARYDN